MSTSPENPSQALANKLLEMKAMDPQKYQAAMSIIEGCRKSPAFSHFIMAYSAYGEQAPKLREKDPQLVEAVDVILGYQADIPQPVSDLLVAFGLLFQGKRDQ